MAAALEEGSLSDSADALEGGPLSDLAGALEEGPRCDSAGALEEGSLNRADAEGEGHAISDATNFSSSGADGSNEGEEGTLDCADAEGEEGALADAADRCAPEAEAAGADEPHVWLITITAHHAQRRQADAAEPASAPQGSATGEAKAWATAAGRSSSISTMFNFIRRVSCTSRAAPQ